MIQTGLIFLIRLYADHRCTVKLVVFAKVLNNLVNFITGVNTGDLAMLKISFLAMLQLNISYAPLPLFLVLSSRY
ncbi:MAG: hypothetical protein A2W28_03125 [Gammaproteobacteria bacterium RBG_16_51_14]|nr:MAG: hypothetical protein A2W28_03125 [Gammaproteobacteria bacterium RBG_16_51_14]